MVFVFISALSLISVSALVAFIETYEHFMLEHRELHEVYDAYDRINYWRKAFWILFIPGLICGVVTLVHMFTSLPD